MLLAKIFAVFKLLDERSSPFHSPPPSKRKNKGESSGKVSSL